MKNDIGCCEYSMSLFVKNPYSYDAIRSVTESVQDKQY